MKKILPFIVFFYTALFFAQTNNQSYDFEFYKNGYFKKTKNLKIQLTKNSDTISEVAAILTEKGNTNRADLYRFMNNQKDQAEFTTYLEKLNGVLPDYKTLLGSLSKKERSLTGLQKNIEKLKANGKALEEQLNPLNDELQTADAAFKQGLSQNTQNVRGNTVAAAIETVTEKPSFRNVVNQRCLVIANGFYEWQWHDTKGKNKSKFEIGKENEELFAFAGLYSIWQNPTTGEEKNTYTIVTTEANPLMAEIHNIKKRMPIILRPEDEQKWLQHEPIQKFAYPYEVNLVAKNLNFGSLF